MEPTMASDQKIIDTVPTDFQASFLAEVEINTQHFSSNVQYLIGFGTKSLPTVVKYLS